MTWSAAIWIYLWLAGMAGGAYFTAFMVERLTGGANRRLLQWATYLGIPLAVVGVILLIVDLGRPERFWHLLAEFSVSSPMSMGTWILLVWVFVAIIMAILWWAERLLPADSSDDLRAFGSTLAWIDVIFAVLLIAYTGVLLAVSSQPMWGGTVILPALFVASAISTGVALLVIGAMFGGAIQGGRSGELKIAINQLFGTTEWTIPKSMIARLAEADAVVILVELAALIGFVVWLATSATVGAGAALGLLIAGPLAALFWVGVVLLALLIPLVLDFVNWGKEIEKKAVSRAILLASGCVLVGGLILRAVITIGGQI